jgi:hypothetical protein
MSTVFTLPDLPALQSAYARLTPSGTLAPSASALATNLDFSKAMLGCRGGSALASNENCSWGSLGSGHSEQTATFGSVGYTQSMTGVSAGFQRAIRDSRTLIGAALRYDTGSLDANNAQSLTASALDVGVLAKRLVGQSGALSASLVAGTASYASTRTPLLSTALTSAHGNQKTTFVAAHLRAEQGFATGSTTFKPFVDVGATRINTSGLRETGADTLDAIVAPHSESFTTVETGVSLQTQRHAGATTLRPTLEVSVTQLVGNAQSSADATLAGAPAGVAPFVLTNRLDRTRFNVAPSLEIEQRNKLDVRVGGTYRFSAGSHSFGGYVQIGKKI